MVFYKVWLLFFLLLCAAGCSTSRYEWSNYDNKLYQHYKNPAEYDLFIGQLREVIDEAEASGKVPPGIYAEYGFVLYEKGDFQESVKYFKLESDKWPESRVFMTKMIQNVQIRVNQAKQPDRAISPSVSVPENTVISTEKGASK